MMFLIEIYYWDDISERYEKQASSSFINSNFIEMIDIPNRGDFATIMVIGKENYSEYLVKKKRALEIVEIMGQENKE